MDSDTKKRVNDLFSLMDGISSDIDLKAEIERLKAEIARLNGEIAVLKDSFHELVARFDGLEQAYAHKRTQIKQMKKEMDSLLKDMR